MAKSLLIVESPAKAKTIEKYLGSDFKVRASYGHVRDLPIKKLGVDVKKDFEPDYVIPPKAKKIISELKDAAGSASTIYLATDFDREGEAIAWHIVQALGLENGKGKNSKKIGRITFHEITKSAIEKAVANPREIDMDLVDAQQARRVLDRLVGYKLSPFLWKKVFKGLSAGRVQSVAVRLVVEKEREIGKFVEREYWTIEGIFAKAGDSQTFLGKLNKVDGKPLSEVAKKKEADDLLELIKEGKYKISDVREEKRTRAPAPPFTTSTLQQESYRKLGFSAKQTMMMAQDLYEGVDLPGHDSQGLITYMRTDSYSLADSAVKEARNVIKKEFGEKFVPAVARIYKTKTKGAQEAHEAIRPTGFERTPDDVKQYLEARHFRLYKLIWERAIASQMADAQVEDTKVEIESEKTKKKFTFQAAGSVILFKGFLKVYEEGKDEIEEDIITLLPKLKVGDRVDLKEVDGKQHFTQPPARYTEASLVKELEKKGIGRPSTYAPIMSTIVDRGYIEKQEGKFIPLEAGNVVTDLLVEHFPQVVDYEFSAKMEEELDDIAEGKREWQPVVREFYDPFSKLLSEKMGSVEKIEEKANEKCPECGKELLIKMSRFGKFLACSGFPDCKYRKGLDEDGKEEKEPEELKEKCPKCGSPLVKRQGRYGEFVGCSEYPKCEYTGQLDSKNNIKCPNCKDGQLVIKRTRRGKPFWGCNNYPKCKTAFWDEPTEEKCGKCGGVMVKKNGELKCSKCEIEPYVKKGNFKKKGQKK